MVKEEKMKEKIKSIIFTIIGPAITGFGVSTMLTPNKIVCGGVSGISTILYQTLEFPPGLTFAIINIVLPLLHTALDSTFALPKRIWT
jgi:uncharacterized membrane-anchored protein YitT (DUF2179 family)